MRIHRFLCVLSLAFFVALSSTHACPACVDNINASKTTLDINGGASGGNGLTSLESGYSWSVLFLISMPVCIAGFLAFSIYKECRKMAQETTKSI